jgi:two-component system phosphate regulon sensor histidine kinase PhoR
LRTGPLLALLLGTVILPGVGTLAVGIIALALWREAFDIVFGVLVLVFAILAVLGCIWALAYLRRSERLVQMQTEFVANVSHELRTPLAGIHLLVETLERGAETEERRGEVFALLKERITHLEELVERILRWRRLEHGARTIERTPQEVGALVAEALLPFKGNGEPEIEVVVHEPLPLVLADRDAVVDALRNLLDNAVKYGGEHGSIEVVARPGSDDVVIEVRDQGPGIPRRERKRIFERFYRVPVHLRSKQGTGLGLSIVRHVIQEHRGKIRVESEPGIGSAFIVHLPAADAIEPTIEREADR